MSNKITIDDCVDRDFVWELAQVGHVHVLTRQVVVTGQSLDLQSIKIPKGCRIEFVGASATRNEHRPEVQVTFGWE